MEVCTDSLNFKFGMDEAECLYEFLRANIDKSVVPSLQNLHEMINSEIHSRLWIIDMSLED